VTVNHQVSSGLPLGAMEPSRPTAHVRTRSQSAVVEDMSALTVQPGSGSAPARQSQSDLRDGPLVPPQINIADDDDASDASEPKRNHWFNFRKSRRMSDGNFQSEHTSESGGATTGRSFVVLRDKRPSAPQSADAHTAESSSSAPASSDDPETWRSSANASDRNSRRSSHAL